MGVSLNKVAFIITKKFQIDKNRFSEFPAILAVGALFILFIELYLR